MTGYSEPLRPIPAGIDEVQQLEPSAEDRRLWSQMGAANQPVTVTLDARQWSVVIGVLRVGMAFAPQPGLIRLAHDDAYRQVRAQLPGKED